MRVTFIFITVVFVLSCSWGMYAHAETTLPLTTRPNMKRQMVTKPREETSLDRHYFLAPLYSGANQLNYGGVVNLYGTPTSFTATEKTAPAFGVNTGYVSRRASGFGYSGSLAFEFARKSQGLTGTAGNVNVTGNYSGDGGTNLLTVAANGNYSIGNDFYFFLGANYPLTFATPGAQTLNGLPGYQIGGGYAFTPRISTELGYRVVRMKGTIDASPFTLQIDEVSFPGLLLSALYLF